MKKDIEIPIAKDVHVAIVEEWDKEFLSKDWNAYLINNRKSPIEMALVLSRGFDGELKTSTMRYALGTLSAKTFEKIEMVQDDILTLNNEFLVTYFADNKLYEKRFFFEKGMVTEKNLVTISLIGLKGVFAV